MRNRMHAETPDVHFEYKYLLLAEVDPYEQPIVCSTFTMYKENEIKDHCTLIKVVSLLLDLMSDIRNTRLDLQCYLHKYFVQLLASTFNVKYDYLILN